MTVNTATPIIDELIKEIQVIVQAHPYWSWFVGVLLFIAFCNALFNGYSDNDVKRLLDRIGVKHS